MADDIQELYEEEALYDDLLPKELEAVLNEDGPSIDQWFVW